MPFVIPNYPDATHVFQAAPDAVDFAILAGAAQNTGVVSGGVVSENGLGADMSVDVTAGEVLVVDESVLFAAVNFPIGAADPTNPRIDLVIVDGAMASVAVLVGVPAPVPLMPPFAWTSEAALAAVYVPAGATVITNAEIIDKSIILLPAIDLAMAVAMAVAL